MYRYFAYGLNIESTIAFSDLLPGKENPDVSIRLGATPETLPNVESQGPGFQASPERFLLNVEGTARYLVCEGREILVDPAPGGDAEDVRTFLFGSAFGALFHQRGLLPLHASAIQVGDGCVAFLGSPGEGKSAVAAAFALRGHRVLTDDVCVVSVGDGKASLAFPGLPYVKVCEDMARSLGMDPEAFPRAPGELGKHRIALQDRFSRIPLPLLRAYLLSSADCQDIKTELLEGAGKAFVFVLHTYRRPFLAGRRQKADHFAKCARLGSQIVLKWIMRPRSPHPVDRMVEMVEADLAD